MSENTLTLKTFLVCGTYLTVGSKDRKDIKKDIEKDIKKTFAVCRTHKSDPEVKRVLKNLRRYQTIYSCYHYGLIFLFHAFSVTLTTSAT